MAIYYMIEPWYKKGGGLGALNDCTWAEIQQAAQAGKASDYWAVGDRKAVVLNGTVGGKTFSNQTAYAYILGFNHNASVEGNNTIHFQFGFDALTDGNHIAFIDSSYNNQGSTSAFRMNTSTTKSGGWRDSYMRNTIVPAFINAMPSDLQAVLKTVNKYTYNDSVTATSDKVFLLAEYEVFGAITYAYTNEENSQVQYDYYKDGNSSNMYRDTSTSSLAMWWFRSPATSTYRFCCAGTGDNPYNRVSNQSEGFAPAFVVG